MNTNALPTPTRPDANLPPIQKHVFECLQKVIDDCAFLVRMDYQWFAIAAKGALLPIPCNLETYDANLVALPMERSEEFLSLLGQK